MRRALLLAITVAACDQGVKTEPGSAASSESAESKPPAGFAGKIVPPGPYVVRYNCVRDNVRSGQPNAVGFLVYNETYDLGTKQNISFWHQYPSDPDRRNPPGPIVRPLRAKGVTTIERAVIAVLRGGPYKPEHEVLEGTTCELAISARGVEVFKLEKSGAQELDAASDLARALADF